MRTAARCFVMGQGAQFLRRWLSYKAFIMHSGWGYATREEVNIAVQAIQMNNANGIKHINKMVIDRDSKLRVASVMRNMSGNPLSIRLALTTLDFDVTIFLPKQKGGEALQRLLRGVAADVGCVSLTELALILATNTEKHNDKTIQTALRVSAMGLGLLRYGGEIELDIKRTFLFESKIAGALIDSAFEEGDEEATAFANDISRELIDMQSHFGNTMGLMYGISLN